MGVAINIWPTMHIHNISLRLKWQDVADNPGLLWLGINFNILHYSRCRWVSKWTNLHIMFNLQGIFCSPGYLSTEGFGDLDVVLFERHFNPSLPQHFQSQVLLMYKFAPSQNADSGSLFGIFADTASHIEKMIEMTSNLFWRSPSKFFTNFKLFFRPFALFSTSSRAHPRRRLPNGFYLHVDHNDFRASSAVVFSNFTDDKCGICVWDRICISILC